jgi:hypothetical protein
MPAGQELVGYRVYITQESWPSAGLFYEILPLPLGYGTFATNASPLLGNCSVERQYYVIAVTRGVYGEIESMRSELFEYDPGCEVALEVTLETLETGDLKDGVFSPNTLETYGFISLLLRNSAGNAHGYQVYWNDHPIDSKSNLSVTPRPYTTKIEQDKTYSWANFSLGVGEFSNRGAGYQWGQNQNTFVLPMNSEDESLDISFTVYDDDGSKQDDLWCDIDIVYSSQPFEDWLNFDQTKTVSCFDSEGEGEITLRIRGVKYNE